MPDSSEIVPAISTDEAAAIAADILGESTSPAGADEKDGREEEATASPADDAKVADKEPEVKADDTAGEGAGKSDEKVSAADKDALDNFITSKYGGDRGKFVEGLWNLMNAGSKQHSQIQELQAKLEQALTKPEPVVDVLDTEEGQGLKQQLTTVANRMTAANREQDQILGRVEKTREEIAELRGELKRAEDFEKVQIRQQISSKEGDLKAEERRFRELESSKEDHELRRTELQGKVKSLKATHAEQQQARQQAVAQTQVYAKAYRTEVETAMDDALSSRGFKDDKVRQAFWRHLQGQAALHWQSDPNSPLPDAEDFVKSHADEYFVAKKAADTAAFNTKAKEKLAASPAGATKAPAAVAKAGESTANNPPKGKMTLQQSLEWRRKYLG